MATRAIPIVKPATATSATASPRLGEASVHAQPFAPGVNSAASPAKKPGDTSTRLCKNIAIYGSCKFEGRGCAFSHDVEGKRTLATPTSSRPSTPSSLSNLTASSISFTPNASVFTPSAPSSTASASASASLAASANVFVPKASTGAATPKLGEAAAAAEQQEEANEEDEDFDGLNPYAAVQSPSSATGALPALSSSYHSAHSGHSGQAAAGGSYDQSSYAQDEQHRLANEEHAQHQQQDYGSNSEYMGEGHAMHQQPLSATGMDPSNPYLNGAMHGMHDMFGHGMHQPLQYHLYHPSLPHTAPSHLSPHLHAMHTFFMSPTLREDLQRKQESCHPPSAMLANRDLLLNDKYWGLIPLDKSPPNLAQGSTISSRLYGWRSWLWRCTNDRDGKLYAVRRIEGYRLTNPDAIMQIDKWSRITHPGIVTAREAFTTRAFGDHSLCFVHDYHPLSSTLLEAHLTGPPRGQPPPPPLPERVLWSYLVQLASAVRTVHKAGMAVRCLDPSKVIITGKNRLRINGIGILDVLAYDANKNTASFQQEDLLSLGKLFLSLACRSLSAIHNIQQSLDMGVSRTYSSEFSNALLYLLSKPNPARKSIDEFWGIISGHVDNELRGAFDQADMLEGELMRELENARLVRLVAKFGFINERPEYDRDPRWAETGDRYIIKLFRDYVFHQVDEQGRPVIDLSHVLTCLNKLDAGVDEQLVLVSRDEQSCLIVSYREVRSCLENSFRELAR